MSHRQPRSLRPFGPPARLRSRLCAVVCAAALAPALLLMACGGSSHPRPPSATTAPTISASSSPSASAAAAASPAPLAGAADLQQRLEGALLTPGDVPAGFVASRIPPRADFLAGADATAVAVYARGVSGGPGAEQIVVALFGFRDALSAASGLGEAQNAVQALTTLPGGTLAVAQIPNSGTIADATQTYRIAGTLAGVSESGFAVYWRRGNLVAGVAEFGADATLLPPAVQTLAQTQDARLAAAGFSLLSARTFRTTPAGRGG